jgi:hypothetical protein
MRTRIKSSRTPTRLMTLTAMLLIAALATAGIAIARHHHHGWDHPSGPTGTIQSFDEGTGMLTIDLEQGGTVSGLVTDFTWIDSGGDHCGSQGQMRWGGCDQRRDGGGDWGGHHADTSALQPGTVVDDAVLVLKDGRAFFLKIDLAG